MMRPTLRWWCPRCWWEHFKSKRRTKPVLADLYERILNPTGATCICAKSSAVWCKECEGNKR